MPAERWTLAIVLSAAATWAAAQEDAETVMPDLDFIEYLGTMMRADDGWIDPLDFERGDDIDSEVTTVRVDEPVPDLEKQP